MFFQRLPQASHTGVPPERLPRRAVRVWGRTAAIKPVCLGCAQFSGCGIGSLKRSASKCADAIGQGVTKSELVAQWRAQHHGQLVEFESEAFVGFQRSGRVAREHVPDLDQEFAGKGGDGDIAVAFSGEEFPAPLAQGRGAAHAQNGLSPLDEEMAEVTTASFAHAEFDVLARPALALAGDRCRPRVFRAARSGARRQ